MNSRSQTMYGPSSWWITLQKMLWKNTLILFLLSVNPMSSGETGDDDEIWDSWSWVEAADWFNRHASTSPTLCKLKAIHHAWMLPSDDLLAWYSFHFHCSCHRHLESLLNPSWYAAWDSFLLRKSTTLYNRRQSKIVSTLTSLFTSSYVFHWPQHFPNNPLKYPPSFDGRIVLYPTAKHIRDYFAWRQADSAYHFSPCHGVP